MSALTPFDFEGRAVRVVEDEAGVPWFVALDVCECLGIRNHRDAVARLDDDERANVGVSDVSSSTRDTVSVNAVSEPGVYKLCFRSNKPEAKRLVRWITHDVLPSLRRTGRYEVPVAASAPQPIPSPPNHRADVLVSAGRIFAAALRTARTARMAPARAMRAAFACAQRHTGVDWTDELGVEVGADPAGADVALAYDDSIAWFYTALTAGGIPGVSAQPALSTDVYDLYQQWCNVNGNRAAPQQHFIHALQRRYRVACARKRYRAGTQVLGPHGVLYLGDSIPPSDRSETDWLGEQISVFHAAAQTYREATG